MSLNSTIPTQQHAVCNYNFRGILESHSIAHTYMYHVIPCHTYSPEPCPIRSIHPPPPTAPTLPLASHLSTVTFASFAHLAGARTTIEYIGVVANPIVLQNYNAGSMRTRYGESVLLVTCLLSYICLPHHFYMMLNEFLVLKHAHAASMASILLPITFSIVILQASRLLSSKRLSSPCN